MSVLDSVIKLRALEQEQAQQNVETFIKGVTQAQEMAKASMLADITQKGQMVDLAKSGLGLDPSGNIVANPVAIEALKQVKEADPITQYYKELRAEKLKQELDAQNEVVETPDPVTVKSGFLENNPQYIPSDITLQPRYVKNKGRETLTGYDAKVNPQAYQARLVSERAGESLLTKAEEKLEAIKEVKKGIKFFGTFGGKVPPLVGQEAKKRWKTNLDLLLSRQIVELINDMKSQSKTGATGFGQLNKEELKILQDGATALKADIGETQAMEILNKMEKQLAKVRERRNTFLTFEDAKYSNLPSGSSFFVKGKEYKVN
jgi:hypothetical protein